MKSFLKFNAGTWDAIVRFTLGSVLPVAIILVAGLLIIRLVMLIVNKFLDASKMEKAAHRLIKTVIRVVLYGLLALMVASKLGVDVTGVVAMASVLTLAISLSIQNALTNVISGFTLCYTDPFSAGDYVEIAGKSGTVREIGLTYTTLCTPDNKLIYIPNGSVTSAEIINYTVQGTRRSEFNVSASYDSPVELVLESLRQAAQVEGVLAEPDITVAVTSYGDSAINYVLRVWATNEHFWPVTHAINANIKKVFDANGVIMTYPHLNVHLDKGE